MNIKPFIAAAVIALTAACTEEPTVVEVPEEVELNDDGTPADVAEGPVVQDELDNGQIRPRDLSEDNPAFKPAN